MDGFEPCPISPYGPYYDTGGFGEIDKYNAFRWSGELKSTHLFEAAGRHELKYGWHADLSSLDLNRRISGNGFDYQVFPGAGTYNSTNFFTLSQGENATNYTTGLSPTSNLLYSPDFRNDLHAYIKSVADAFSCRTATVPLISVTSRLIWALDWNPQKIYDFQGTSFLDTNNFAPRMSGVFDPFNDGRSKLSVSYGRFYEAVPLDVAARYFGGENFLERQNIPLSNCPGAVANPYQWTGNCMQPAAGQPDPHGLAFFNSEYPQPNLQGQYQNEIVATAEREIFENTTMRLDYQHRWLGTIIEDGSGPGYANGVLANPGHVPQSAIDAAQHLANQAAAAAAANPADPTLASAATNAQYNLATLQTLASAPPPERTYNAVTLSLNTKLSNRWFARASYTYSRLIGNYEGLYQNETNYIAPNGNNAYDAPELYVNQNGALPNDHPHLFHLDGFYTHPAGRGHLTVGLSFSARSGTPRNYVSNLIPQSPYQVVLLLPRGDAGRSPTVMQLNGRISYGRSVSPRATLEGFIDFFNILDQQAATTIDDNYTFNAAAPIANGTPQDLKFAKNAGGTPITKNPDFGQALAYQTPFNCRLGARLTF